MIDSVGRIVFPTSLFGCSDPVIYNGPIPCLIHTSPAERGCIQEAGLHRRRPFRFPASDILSGRNCRAKINVQRAVHQM